MKVVVLRIEHRHGDNVSVCVDMEIANQRLWEYVESWWQQEIGEITIPSDRQAAIDRYFEAMRERFSGAEYYYIEETEIDYGG